MSLRLSVLLVPLLLVGTLITLAVRALRRGRGESADVFSGPGTRAIARHLTLWRVIALLAAVPVGYLALTAATAPGPSLGRWAGAVPGIVAVALLVGSAVGELTSPREKVEVRSASLGRRSIADSLPRRGLYAVGAGTGVLAAVLAYAVARGVPDDQGRAGRAVATQSCGRMLQPDGSYVEVPATGTHGPWPGSWYALPMALSLVVAVALAAFCLHLVARRPRPGLADAAYDDVLRRQSAGGILAALGVGVFGTLVPVASLIAAGVNADRPCPLSSSLPVLPGVFVLLSVLGLVGFLGCAVWLLVPRPAAPAPAGAPVPESVR